MSGVRHTLCLLSGVNHPLSSGFFNEASLDPGDEEIFRFDDANCSCACPTCEQVRAGNMIFLYRYLPNGREVVKVVRT